MNISVQDYIKKTNRRKAFPAEALTLCDFAHDSGENPDATGTAKRFTEKFEEIEKYGSGLFIFGGRGSGKSFMAAEIVNELTDRGYKCKFTSLLFISMEWNSLPPGNRILYLDKLFENRLIVLDDFGVEAQTTVNLQLLEVISVTCQQKHIPLVIATPYSRDALLKESKGRWKDVVTRLLYSTMPFVISMPAARRARMLKQKREMGASLLHKTVAEQPDMFDGPEGETPETGAENCPPKTFQQTLPFGELKEIKRKTRSDKEKE